MPTDPITVALLVGREVIKSKADGDGAENVYAYAMSVRASRHTATTMSKKRTKVVNAFIKDTQELERKLVDAAQAYAKFLDKYADWDTLLDETDNVEICEQARIEGANFPPLRP